MKKLINKPALQIDPESVLLDKQEPYEIIYANPRDEEIHLKFLKKDQVSAPMPRWYLDCENNHLIWSDGIFELLELDARKYGANYSSFLEIVHPEDHQLKNQVQEDLQKTSKPIEINYRLLFSDGRIKWVNEICNTDFDQEGNPIRSYGIIQDISKYKLIEENFRKKEEWSNNLIESIPSAIAVIQNNRFVFANSACKRLLLGNAQVQLKGKTISKIVLPESRKYFLKKIKSATKGHLEPTFEEKLISMDGSVYNAEVTLTQTIFQGFIAVQLIVNEITKRKKTEEALYNREQKFKLLSENLSDNETRLKELIATKDKFFSIIAHDLRSPFNSIIGILELMQNQYEEIDDSEKKEFLKLIENDARNTLKLLENLLEWAKIQTGNISFQPTVQKLLPIVENAAKTLNSTLNLKRLSLQYSISEHLEIFADTNMLTTVFQNLISNAIKYSHAEGVITVHAELNNNQIELIVSDTGTGMREETKNKLFRIDKHVSIPGTANEKGSGLGLILCKDFIEKHKGTIWVESEPGIGSKFIFRIPQKN